MKRKRSDVVRQKLARERYKMKNDARTSSHPIFCFFFLPVSVSNHSRANRVHMPIIYFKEVFLTLETHSPLSLSLTSCFASNYKILRSCVFCYVFHVCRKLSVVCFRSRDKMGKGNRRFAVYYIRFCVCVCIYIYIYISQ